MIKAWTQAHGQSYCTDLFYFSVCLFRLEAKVPKRQQSSGINEIICRIKLRAAPRAQCPRRCTPRRGSIIWHHHRQTSARSSSAAAPSRCSQPRLTIHGGWRRSLHTLSCLFASLLSTVRLRSIEYERGRRASWRLAFVPSSCTIRTRRPTAMALYSCGRAKCDDILFWLGGAYNFIAVSLACTVEFIF